MKKYSLGGLSCRYDKGTIRNIEVNGTEIVNSIYCAVRDSNWNTIKGSIKTEKVIKRNDIIEISFTVSHRSEDVAFGWKGVIKISHKSISFKMFGEVESSFLKNRIGFLVLHPMALSGKECIVKTTSGNIINGTFPKYIYPNQPFLDIKSISYNLKNGLEVTTNFYGDIFEMEDQRNWTDASFKTYCTPLANKFPVRVIKGEKIEQEIIVEIRGAIESKYPEHGSVEIELGTETIGPLLSLGTCFTGDHENILKQYNLDFDYLRIDVYMGCDGWEKQFYKDTEAVLTLKKPILYFLHVKESYIEDLTIIREMIEHVKNSIISISVLSDEEKCSTGALCKTAKEIFGNEYTIGGGTDAFFAELNRNRPDLAKMDYFSYSINPQVHAFDDESLIESLECQSETVKSARIFAGGLPILVSPVTFKMRWNPNAADKKKVCRILPVQEQYDQRIETAFGACWLLGSIKNLSESGASSATYFEYTGKLGIVNRKLSPVYNIFKSLLKVKNSEILESKSTQPKKVECLYLKGNLYRTIYIINYENNHNKVIIKGLDAKGRISVISESVSDEKDFFLKNNSKINLSPNSIVEIRFNGGKG